MENKIRRRTRNKDRKQAKSIHLGSIHMLISTVLLLLLASTALLPDIFTVVLCCVFAAILSIAMPELFNNPARQHATITLWVVGFIAMILLLFDTAFLTISLCMGFGLLCCFLNEIFRFSSRENLLYSLYTNIVAMLCVVGSIAWIIFTDLYSWHFYVLPLCISVMVTMLFSNALLHIKGYSNYKYKYFITSIITFVTSFIVSWIMVKIAYSVGYQLYVTSAVLLDSSDQFILNYLIPIVYSTIISVISLGYLLVEKSLRVLQLKPKSIISLIAMSLIPISLISMPTYMLLRIIGG